MKRLITITAALMLLAGIMGGETVANYQLNYTGPQIDAAIANMAALEAGDITAYLENNSALDLGSPAGAYADLTALIADDPDHSKIYITLDDGNWCYHSGSTFVAGGVYQATAVADGSITAEKTNFISLQGRNRYDLSTIVAGYYVNEVFGTLEANGSYNASDYIPVEAGDIYLSFYSDVSASGFRYALYNTSKVFVSGAHVTSAVPQDAQSERYYLRITVASDGYLRFSAAGVVLAGHECMVNTSPDVVYEPFCYEKKMDSDLMPTDIQAFLPGEICCAVGRTIEIYNKQVCPLAHKYHFKWDCNIGKVYDRKFSVTGTGGNTGTHDLTLTIYDDDLNVLWQRKTKLRIYNAYTGTKSVLCIGDSMSNEKPWIAELKNLNPNFTFVGTRNASTNDSDSEMRFVNAEGRSGFSAADYLAATTYLSEGVQPFWNAGESRFDWDYYKTTESIDPDAVHILLGTNGIAIDPTANVANIKSIVDYIRDDDAAIPIYISCPIYQGNQDGIGQVSAAGIMKFEEDMKVFNLMKAIHTTFIGYTNVWIVPLSLLHDSEYSFGINTENANPRMSDYTVDIPDEGIHPVNPDGYWQFADAIYSVMSWRTP